MQKSNLLGMKPPVIGCSRKSKGNGGEATPGSYALPGLWIWGHQAAPYRKAEYHSAMMSTRRLSARSQLYCLFAARAARGFGDGFAAIVLPAYLIEIGFGPLQIGLIATAALLGSAALTLAIGLVAPRYDLRTLLLLCAALMAVTGLAFPSSQHFVLIAAIAFIGTMNPTTGDIGVHVPLEQAALAHGVSDQDRTRVFARYSLIGALSIAAGALAAGAPDLLVSLGMGRIGALQAMFYVYAALGLVGALFYSRLPRAEVKEAAPRATALGPSRRTVYKLAALFSLDSFAGGFTVQSLMALWL